MSKDRARLHLFIDLGLLVVVAGVWMIFDVGRWTVVLGGAAFALAHGCGYWAGWLARDREATNAS